MSFHCHVCAQRLDINKKWQLLPQKHNFSKNLLSSVMVLHGNVSDRPCVVGILSFKQKTGLKTFLYSPRIISKYTPICDLLCELNHPCSYLSSLATLELILSFLLGVSAKVGRLMCGTQNFSWKNGNE